MKSVRAFCFDVFGTVVDWREGVARDAQAFFSRQGLHGIDPRKFADAWRGQYQPAMEACRKGQRPYTRLDVLHRENLDTILVNYQVDLDAIPEADLNWLNLAWHRLDPWPDVIGGLNRLKERYIIAPASNGNISLMVDIAKRSGIAWDAILGAEVTRAYKPAAQAYLQLAEILGLEPAQVCMVAAHNNDLYAARRCGLSTAFVPRTTEHGPDQTTDLAPAEPWDVVANDFHDLADQVLARGAA